MKKKSGLLLDPHSAIAVHAAEQGLAESDGPVVALATAHAAKFPLAVIEATGVTPELPPNLSDLMHRNETCAVLPNNIDRVRQFIDERVKA